jgi:hypothetical protein
LNLGAATMPTPTEVQISTTSTSMMTMIMGMTAKIRMDGSPLQAMIPMRPTAMMLRQEAA